MAQKVFDEKLSVRDIEKLVKNLGKTKVQKKSKEKQLGAIYQEIEETLKGKLSTKVSIVAKENGAGKIEVEFFSHEELDRLIDIIMK